MRLDCVLKIYIYINGSLEDQEVTQLKGGMWSFKKKKNGWNLLLIFLHLNSNLETLSSPPTLDGLWLSGIDALLKK